MSVLRGIQFEPHGKQMRSDPTTDKEALLKTLEHAYGLAVHELRFIPTEWQAYCYVVECSSGERYFLKLYENSQRTSFAASCRDFYIPLTYELHAKRILPRIPHPIPAVDGQLVHRAQGFSLLLCNYIDGEIVGQDGMTSAILVKLAALLGRLHRSSTEIAVRNALVERFEMRFEAEMRRICETPADALPEQSKGTRRLQDQLLTRKDDILGRLTRLKELQQRARTMEHTMVICHTDLHGDNLMLDRQGYLYLLDWENAMLAPAEHDLMFLANHEGFWRSFLPIYEREIASVRLNADVLSFYYYRRDLEDLMDWIVRVTEGEGDETRDAAHLHEIVDVLDGLSEIEQKVGRIQEGWRRYHGE